jgi:hypothetical protein
LTNINRIKKIKRGKSNLREREQAREKKREKEE